MCSYFNIISSGAMSGNDKYVCTVF